MSIKKTDLERIEELQHYMEKKHCHDLEYADDQPQFCICGIMEEATKEG